MGHIQKSHFFRHISDPQCRIFQQFFGCLHPDLVQKFRKALTCVFIQQLAQMPLAHIRIVRHLF